MGFAISEPSNSLREANRNTDTAHDKIRQELGKDDLDLPTFLKQQAQKA